MIFRTNHKGAKNSKLFFDFPSFEVQNEMAQEGKRIKFSAADYETKRGGLRRQRQGHVGGDLFSFKG
jgi:hypothetical protein